MSDLTKRLKHVSRRKPASLGQLWKLCDEAADRIAELEAVVREVEWGGTVLNRHAEEFVACPMCCGSHAIGHHRRCRLAAVLPSTPTAARDAGEGGWDG